MNRVSRPLLAAIFLFSAASRAGAGYELVNNGDFETGSLQGWTSGGDNSVALGYGLDGGYGVKYGTLGGAAPLYQAITTTPGATYTFSFWQQTRAPGPNEFQAYWNGNLILDLIDSPASNGFTQYVFLEVATRTATEIRFGLRQDGNYSAMDQVSVQLAAVVPEPSSLLMVGTAFILAGARAFAGRRKIREASRGGEGPGPAIG